MRINVYKTCVVMHDDPSLNKVCDYGSYLSALDRTRTQKLTDVQKSTKLKSHNTQIRMQKKTWSPKASPDAPPSSCPSQSESKPHHSCPPPFQHSQRNRHNSALNNSLTAVENGRSRFGCFSSQSHYVTPYPCALESSFPENDGE